MKILKNLLCLLMLLALVTAFSSCGNNRKSKVRIDEDGSPDPASAQTQDTDSGKTNPTVGDGGIEGPIIDLPVE